MKSEVPESKPTVLIVPVVAALIAGALAIAAWRAAPRARELDWLRRLERADAASATASPALYRGKLRGPAERKTPSGERAAAFWWAVVHRDGDGSEVLCQGRERSGLWLETTTGTLRIAFTDADPAVVGLVTDDKSNEYDRPIAIDLGSTTRTVHDALPAGTCSGHDASYEQLILPDGAAVEVGGCVKDGRIGECAGPLAAVLSVPDVEVDRRHRLEEALDAFRVALAISSVLLLIAGLTAVMAVSDALRVLRPGKST